MKRLFPYCFTLLLCICFLSACHNNEQRLPDETPPPVENTMPDETPNPPADEITPTALNHLTFELVVDWSEGDRLLPELDNLSQLLQESLLTQHIQVDEVTITISTAGGFTGDSLATGGIDAALLPASDYVACRDGATAVLATDTDLPTTILAVSDTRAELDDAFRSALATALLETEDGQAFLDTYQSGITYAPLREDALQAMIEQFDTEESKD